MAHGRILQRVEEWDAAFKVVQSHFQDEVKTRLWLREPNPLLGGISPAAMIGQGRFAKLMKFIEATLQENRKE